MLRLIIAVATATAIAQAAAPGQIETLQPLDSLPASILSKLELPVSCARTRSGEYIVLDRRAHTVYAIDAQKTQVRRVVQIGVEKGRVLRRGALRVLERRRSWGA